jgi:hypothetical protein
MERGHSGLCLGEDPPPPKKSVKVKKTNTPWHWMRDSLVKRYGDDVGNWLAQKAGNEMRRCDCIDNVSFCELTTRNRTEQREHKKQRESGCCGSFDTTFHHKKSGRRFMFGFNYGH